MLLNPLHCTVLQPCVDPRPSDRVAALQSQLDDTRQRQQLHRQPASCSSAGRISAEGEALQISAEGKFSAAGLGQSEID